MNISWQSAETAPRDGSEFVALLENGALVILRWAGEGSVWWGPFPRSLLVAVEPRGFDGHRIMAWHQILPRPTPTTQPDRQTEDA